MTTERAVSLGQDMRKIPFQDRSWLGYQTRSSKWLIQNIIYELFKLSPNVSSARWLEFWYWYIEVFYLIEGVITFGYYQNYISCSVHCQSSGDATLSKHSGINFEHLHFTTRIMSTKSAEVCFDLHTHTHTHIYLCPLRCCDKQVVVQTKLTGNIFIYHIFIYS